MTAAIVLIAALASPSPGPGRGHAHRARPASAGSSPAASPSSPAPSSPAATARPAGTIGAYAVGRLHVTVTDRGATGLDGAQLGSRTLPVLVRYPAGLAGRSAVPAPAAPGGGGRYPLIVFAPGYLQCTRVYAHLLHAWASAGYVVAAVTFPVTNCLVRGSESDLENQPSDISRVITRLLAMSSSRSGRLAGLIKPGEIGVAGHSDGGDTTIAVAANTCCRDRRIRAAVVLAGQAWAPFGSRYFPPGSPPVLFVQGSADTVNLPATSAAMYRQDTAGPRFYLRVLGGTHWSPYEGSSYAERLVARVTTAFWTRYLTGAAAARAQLTRRSDIPGVAHLFSGRAQPPA